MTSDDLIVRRGPQVAQSPKGVLSARELEVAELLAKPYKVIAYELGEISPETVKKHVQSIVRKTGASSRIEAALILERRRAA